MIAKYPYIHIARFVLKAETAFALFTGLADGTFDNTILRDANNLPTISGTTLAGILRHRFAIKADEQTTNEVFGFADRAKEAETTNRVSRLQISWGCIHNSKNQAVEGLKKPNEIKRDPLLERLSQDHLICRERVALNKRGVAKERMKFDVTLAPAGCRFSFEMSLWSDKEKDTSWDMLLEIIQSPLQLGSASRSGIGHFKLQQLYQDCFDLRDSDQYANFTALSAATIDDISKLIEKEDIPKESNHDIKIELQAKDFWQFGETAAPLKKSDTSPNSVPLSEPIIEWNTKGGELTATKQIVIPGSGIKGALAHRLEFHYRCLTGDFSNKSNAAYEETDHAETRIEKDLTAPLMGYAADTKQDQNLGQAGLLFFHDIYMSYDETNLSHIMHTSIDRFTGGVRDGALFSEEMVWKKSWDLKIDIDWQRLELLRKSEKSKSIQLLFKALHLTLNDLQEERLPLGAGSSKGHGYFEGKERVYSDELQNHDLKQWMEGV